MSGLRLWFQLIAATQAVVDPRIVTCNDQRHPVVYKLGKQVGDLGARDRVECACRFVSDQKRGAYGHAAKH